MKAFIYAAGRGLRLGKDFRTGPKILLRFGGRSLLDWHLHRLQANGITHVTVIAGFSAELVQNEIKRLAPSHNLSVDTLLNPDYTEGSVLSFHVSVPRLEALQEPVLLMDGDVLYPGRFIERLIHSPHKTALLIDRDYSVADDDPVLVPIVAGRPVDFVKQWKGKADAIGESIGFFKVHQDDLPLLIDETNRRTAGEAREQSYDDVLRVMVQAGRFGHEDVTGLPWTEIDFPGDVDRAEREVLPAIERL